MFLKLSFMFWALLATGILTSLSIKGWERIQYCKYVAGQKSYYDRNPLITRPALTWLEKGQMGLMVVVILVAGWYLVTLP